MKLTRSVAPLAALALSLGLVGCSSDEAATTRSNPSTTVAESSSSTSEPAKKLTVLVSNDDGYSAPGIDALVEALTKLPDTEVIVSAPATQQSGKGSSVTDGMLVASDAETRSGHPAHAVQGTPADSVNWALDGGIDVRPDVVITGINMGQNVGSIGDQVSGTLGAARAGAAHGIPALATSMGIHTEGDKDVADYALAATYVVEWVNAHRDDLVAGNVGGAQPLLENLNVPSCNSGGKIRGVASVTMSTSAEGAFEPDQNCNSTIPTPADDISAFNNGFVTISSASLTKR